MAPKYSGKSTSSAKRGQGESRPHVALLIETSRSYSRHLLRGVKRYISEHEPWSVFMELRALDSPPPPWLKNWRGQGILARTGSREMGKVLAATGVPTVELRSRRLNPHAPFVGTDNAALGRMIAEHLLERGFRRFGVYGIDTEDYFEERCKNFVETLQALGLPCDVYHPPDRRELPLEWEKQQEDVAAWVAGLQKPVGLMACTDQLGFWLLDACSRAGVAVPEEAAVVGVENDESLASMSTPPLSSLQFNAERTGYVAAALLDRMMAGEAAPTEPVLIEPLAIVTRQSSEIVALEDKEVADAVRLIRQRACTGLTVEEVLAAVGMSRSALDRRMRQVLGRTPKAEIMRVQLEKVKQLLTETDLSLASIADKTGFKHPQYLAELFKQKLGETPGAFRAKAESGVRKAGERP